MEWKSARIELARLEPGTNFNEDFLRAWKTSTESSEIQTLCITSKLRQKHCLYVCTQYNELLQFLKWMTYISYISILHWEIHDKMCYLYNGQQISISNPSSSSTVSQVTTRYPLTIALNSKLVQKRKHSWSSRRKTLSHVAPRSMRNRTVIVEREERCNAIGNEAHEVVWEKPTIAVKSEMFTLKGY